MSTKPQTIVIDEALTPLDEFIQQEFHCCLCGGDLEFNHVYDFLNQKVSEQSSCSKCKIEISNKEHSLH